MLNPTALAIGLAFLMGASLGWISRGDRYEARQAKALQAQQAETVRQVAESVQASQGVEQQVQASSSQISDLRRQAARIKTSPPKATPNESPAASIASAPEPILCPDPLDARLDPGVVSLLNSARRPVPATDAARGLDGQGQASATSSRRDDARPD